MVHGFTGSIFLPEGYSNDDPILAKQTFVFSNKESITPLYDKLRCTAQKENTATDDGMIQGKEGYIFYLETDTLKVEQFKCKPEMIEEIHWAASKTVSKHVIHAACMKSYENFGIDGLIYKKVYDLLLEDYTVEQLERASLRIAKIANEVYVNLNLKREVFHNYSVYLNKVTSKAAIMRNLGSIYGKKEMKKVYSALKSCGVFDEEK